MPGVTITEIMPSTINADRMLLTDLGRSAVYNVSQFDRVSVQAVLSSGTWGTGVITFTCSNDGLSFSTFATPVRLSADGFTAEIDTRSFNYLRAMMTAAGSSSSYVDLIVKGWTQP